MDIVSRILVVGCLTVASCNSLSPIHVDNGNFVDREGRVRLFRGINSVIKWFPWYDPVMLDPARHQMLADWGFNAIRLGSMWNGFQPEEEGKVNETYADILKEIVEGLGSVGIYTYLDMHQDMLTEKADYEGVPRWLSSKFKPPEHAYPWPMNNTHGFSTWACGYFSQEISNGFQQLYTEHKKEFAEFWRQVAIRFRNNPAILGYELMNEPWTGDIFSDASIILPGNAGYELLEPFFNAASDAIREVDDETIIFWEPVTYSYIVNVNENIILDSVLDAYLKTHNFTDFLPILEKACGDMADDFRMSDVEEEFTKVLENLADTRKHRIDYASDTRGRPNILGPGFTAPPGGPDYLNRTALSWHYYCWALGFSSDEEFDPVLKAVCDDFLGPMVFNTVDSTAQEIGGSATFLTEFGLCAPSYDHPDWQGSIVCDFILDQADQHLQSWSYWDTAYGDIFWDSNGEPILDAVKVFTRPYPQATAGFPIKLEFQVETRNFMFEYQPNSQIASPTEIYVPHLIYNDGFIVEVSENLEWKEDESDKQKIFVTASNDELGVVKIVPKL